MKTNKSNQILRKITGDKIIRTIIARRNHFLFFVIYFGEYMKYETARFQKEMFKLTENPKNELLVVAAFRGSAKSTIMTLSYSIWSILGKQNKKYVLILSKTQERSQEHLMNIRRVLEDNELLKNDMGPFEEETNQWGVKALTLKKFNAKIATGSLEQSIRGTRFNQHRPDLIIIDDIEDLEQVKSKEGRDKVFQWFTGEIVPARERGGKIVIVGGILDKNSLISNLKKRILEGNLPEAVYREYPIIDSEGNPQWIGKFANAGAIERERMMVLDERTWQTEYMLNPVEDIDTIVYESWIQYYDDFPQEKHYDIQIGVDLAISEEESADCTAILPARIYGEGRDAKIYVLPGFINEKLNFPKTIETIKLLEKGFNEGEYPLFLVEDVAYQRSAIQTLEQEGISVKGIKIGGQNKRARMVVASNWIKTGKILFPFKGAERLIEQLTGFGVDRYDDLADALTVIILHLIEEARHYASGDLITIIEIEPPGETLLLS